MTRAPAFLRAIAFLIDLAMVFLAGLLLDSISLLGYAIGSWWSLQGNPALPLRFLSLLLGLFYFTYLTMDGAQTIGKVLMGIRVARTNGQDVGMIRALWRSCSYLLSAFPLLFGFLLAFVIKGRSFHDLLAGTMVIKEEP